MFLGARNYIQDIPQSGEAYPLLVACVDVEIGACWLMNMVAVALVCVVEPPRAMWTGWTRTLLVVSCNFITLYWASFSVAYDRLRFPIGLPATMLVFSVPVTVFDACYLAVCNRRRRARAILHTSVHADNVRAAG